VTPITQKRGERVYAAWRWLASETSHIESEAGEHKLNAFQAIRPMDEVMVANFTAFHDLVSDKQYDLCPPRHARERPQRGRDHGTRTGHR
jgi:hypothetical protein